MSKRLVEVTWRDSARMPWGWGTRKHYRRGRSAKIRTVGRLLQANRHDVIVALSSSNYRHVCDAIAIPASAVVRIRSVHRG